SRTALATAVTMFPSHQRKACRVARIERKRNPGTALPRIERGPGFHGVYHRAGPMAGSDRSRGLNPGYTTTTFPPSQPTLSCRRPLDVLVLRMTAIACASPLLHLLPELGCGAGLTGVIRGGGRVLGDAIKGIEVLPYSKRRSGVDRRAIGPYAGLRLRREEM